MSVEKINELDGGQCIVFSSSVRGEEVVNGQSSSTHHFEVVHCQRIYAVCNCLEEINQMKPSETVSMSITSKEFSVAD